MSVAAKLVLVMFVLLFLGSPWRHRGGQASASDAISWPERFQKEAPPAWEAYRERAKRLQGSFSLTFLTLPEKRLELQRRAEIKQREGCALFMRQTLKEENEKELRGGIGVVNPKYRFELRRGNPDAEWAVSKMKLDSSSGTRLRPPEEDVEKWSACPVNFVLVNYDSLRVFPTDPEYKLKGVSPVVRDAREWAKVEFEYRPQGKPRVPSIAGWILYDPAREWVIGAFDLQLTWPAAGGATAAKTAIYEYRDGGTGFPILKRIVCRFKNPAKSYEREDTYEFDLREADVPESDFTLSAFGFPDPVGTKPPERSRTWLWVAAAALSFAILGVFFVQLKRRAIARSNKQPPPHRSLP